MNITEKDNVHPAWHEEAKGVTLETLPAFLSKLVNNYQHDYGTICHAMAAAMGATMSAINKHEQGGITGFQASCVMWEVLQHSFHIKPPARLVQYEELLYPQYARKFNSITPDTFAEVRKLAQKRLAEGGQMHPNVHAHMVEIAEHGRVPFGLVLADD